MIDSLLMLVGILSVIMVTGALAGSSRARAAGARSFSWEIIAIGTLVGDVLGSIVVAGGIAAWVLLHRWAGVKSSIFLFETLSSLAVGSVCGWLVAYRFSDWQHRKRHQWLTRNQS